MVFTLVAATLLGVATGCGKPASQVKPTVVLAIQPGEAVAHLTAKYDELNAFLEKETGFEVKVFVPTTHTAIVEAL